MNTVRPKGDDPYGLGGNSLPGRQRPHPGLGFVGGGYGEPGLVALDAVVGAVHMALGGEDVAVALFGVVHFGRGGLKIARLFVDAPKRNLCARATPKTTMAITRSKCGRDTNPKPPPKAPPKDGDGNLVSHLSLLLPPNAQHAVVGGIRYTVETYEKSEDGDRVFLNQCAEGSTVEATGSMVAPTKAAPKKRSAAKTKSAAGKQPAPKTKKRHKTKGAARKQPTPKTKSAALLAAVPKKRIPKHARERAWQLQLLLGFEERPGPLDPPTDKNILLRQLFAELDHLREIHPTLWEENKLWL